jgi:hypothetical protein
VFVRTLVWEAMIRRHGSKAGGFSLCRRIHRKPASLVAAALLIVGGRVVVIPLNGSGYRLYVDVVPSLEPLAQTVFLESIRYMDKCLCSCFHGVSRLREA